MFNQEDLSIFGATMEGVPNPRIGIQHPYPTRFHGPIWTQPQAGYPYRSSTYVRPSFNGMGDTTLAEMFQSSAQTSATVAAVALVAGAAVVLYGMGAFGRKPKSMFPQWMAPNRRRRRRG